MHVPKRMLIGSVQGHRNRIQLDRCYMKATRMRSILLLSQMASAAAQLKTIRRPEYHWARKGVIIGQGPSRAAHLWWRGLPDLPAKPPGVMTALAAWSAWLPALQMQPQWLLQQLA